jgi:hypothetical protein
MGKETPVVIAATISRVPRRRTAGRSCCCRADGGPGRVASRSDSPASWRHAFVRYQIGMGGETPWRHAGNDDNGVAVADHGCSKTRCLACPSSEMIKF